MHCLVQPKMNRHDPVLRAQRKKILLLEGALHRLELVEAKAAINNSLQTNQIVGLIKPVLTLKRLLPLAASLQPLVIGKGRMAVWLRRALAVAGVGVVLTSWLKDLRKPAAEDEPE